VVIEFVVRAKNVASALKRCDAVLRRGDRAWVAYQKGRSGATGIDRDTLRAAATSAGLKTVRLIALNAEWSVLRLEIG
jgi:hypothetical protein